MPPLNVPRLAALAVVVHEDHVLLVQRRNPPNAGSWGFPGGHVEWGETGQDAAAREAYEETGMRVTAGRYLTNFDVIDRDDTGAIRFHFMLVAVECNFVAGKPVAGDDALAAAWVPLSDVASGTHPVSERVREVLAIRAAAG